jgi:hypothetical protein
LVQTIEKEEQVMEKLSITRLFAVALFTCVIAGQAMAVPSIWNTGVDNLGDPLADGATDTHYLLGGGLNAVATSPHPNWVAPPAGSKWIGPTLWNVTDPVGMYSYTQSFTLPVDPDVKHYVLSGNWATDNTGEIFLDSVSTGFTSTGYGALSSFSLNLDPGDYTLEFRVENTPVGTPGAPNPTALLVSDISLRSVPVIPAPGAVLLSALGTGIIGLVRRRRSL